MKKNLKIVCAPDSFKNSLSSIDVCEAIRKGLSGAGIRNIVSVPIADGGENTVLSLQKSIRNLEIKYRHVPDSFGKMINGYIGWIEEDKTAIVEMAVATGLQAVKDAMKASSFGTGELISFALDLGAKKIYLAIGGTSSTDCGIGAASALGYRFLDGERKKISLDGAGLNSLEYIETDEVDKRLHDCSFYVISDVNNPLYGIKGAAYVYAPQKGASPEEVEILDRGLRRFSEVVFRCFNLDSADFPGAGAAGGMGTGAKVFFNAEILSGIDTIIDIVGFDNKIKDADLIITGEGKFDSQSLSGKVISGVLRHSHGIPVGVICGKKEIEDDRFAFIEAIEKMAESEEDSMRNAGKYIEETTRLAIEKFIDGLKK